MRPIRSSCLVMLGVAAMFAGTGSDASAAVGTRYDYQGAAAVCQPTLPEHGATLRAQPLRGMTNGTAGTIFLTCSHRGDDTANGRGHWRVTVNVANYSTASAAVINCTLINGRAVGGTSNATYTTRAAIVGAGQGATMNWVPAQTNGGVDTITRPQVQCGLPPGTSLQFIGIHYDENVGA